MIADEVQSGLARTGKMLACDWEEVRSDVVVSTPPLFQKKNSLSLQILYRFHDIYQVLDVNVETFWIYLNHYTTI